MECNEQFYSVFQFHTSITFLFKLNVDSRGGSRVVQVICRNHSIFFPNLISQLFVAVHEINYPSCFIVYYEIKQSRNYSVDLTDLTDASLNTFLNHICFLLLLLCFVFFLIAQCRQFLVDPGALSLD